MSGWSENDSEVYRSIADVAVPRRREMLEALLSVIPFERSATIRALDLGAGQGELSESLLTRFPKATVTALDGSESMRAAASARLAQFGDRARVAAFDVAALDWWDRMFGCDVIVSSMCLHHLNDAKKQYLYKAAAERLSAGGAFLVADLVQPMHRAAVTAAADRWDLLSKAQADAQAAPELFARFEEARWNHFRFPDAADQPSALFHHLVWLRHAGFADVDCVWLDGGHAVFGGFKRAAA